MIDLNNIVTLSSSDITNILLQFFSIGPVLAVLSAVIALALVPKIVRAVRWAVMGPGPRGLQVGVVDESNDPRWVTVPGDLPGLSMEYEVATGSGFSWNESTREEMNQAAAASGDYSLLRFSWDGLPSYDIRNEEGEVVARVVESSEAARDRYNENTRAQG